MKNKNFKIWLRRNGLLCRKYEYKAPSKPRISHTIQPDERLSYNETFQNINNQLKQNK